MLRLDSLSPDELKKLYTRSAYLSQLGTLGMYGVFLYSVIALFFSPWLLLISIPLFAAPYVFMYVRTPAARVYFYIWSISGIVMFGLTILGLFFSPLSGGVLAVYVILSIIWLWISIEVLRSAKTDALFGPDYLTHKQIVFARNKCRKNEPFTDEDISKITPNATLSKICLIIAFIWEGILILGFVGNLFIDSTPPNEYVIQAHQAIEQKKYDEAFRLFQKGAESNSPEAHYGLGMCYINSWGTPQNMAEAANHLEIAAAKGNQHAQYSLGMIYYYGNGRPQDFSTAASLLEKSADQGNKDAQAMLSYKNGKKPDTSRIPFTQRLGMKYEYETQR